MQLEDALKKTHMGFNYLTPGQKGPVSSIGVY